MMAINGRQLLKAAATTLKVWRQKALTKQLPLRGKRRMVTAESGPLHFDLRGKVCVVTGAGSGIGQAVAIGFAQCGGKVVVAGRRQAALDETLLKIAEAAGPAGGTGESFLAVPTDVTDAASVENLFLQCQSVFGRVDVLFNNAGVGAPAVPLEDLDLETWRKVVDVNLTGVFLCTQQAFRVMKAQEPQGGRIINNGSVSAVAPRPLSSAYTATKHAVTGLTKSTSLDGRKYDIACGQIDIGNAATDMTAGVRSGPGVLQPTIDGSERFAQEPTFDVADVARTVCLMASLPPEANIPFVTVMATKMPVFARG